MPHAHEVLSVGNAIVDILSHVNESFVIGNGLQKGAMRLVDEASS